jgi:DNA helicase-2/ATP-dependent DNA helicase PcrA
MPEITEHEIDEVLAIINAANSADEQLVLDAARREAIKSFSDVQACPGSGKTTLVGIKLNLLASQPSQPNSGICVLSHTNVAKDEILKRIVGHPAGQRLTSYPNFVGTIQTFVDTYISLPYARSRGWNLSPVDNATFSLAAHRALGFAMNGKAPVRGTDKEHTLSYYLNRGSVRPGDLRYVSDAAGLTVSPQILDDLNRHVDLTATNFSIATLQNLREQLSRRGLATYQEMYELASQAILEHPELISALRLRFPVCICDEMQDTQPFQEELLDKIFRDGSVQYQKLGDPDQAIYDGLGGEGPSVGYNSGQLTAIQTSHRFSAKIAGSVCGLSARKLIPLGSSRPPSDADMSPVLLVYSEGSQEAVLHSFSEIVAELPESMRRVVKAVGGVAPEGGSAAGLTIQSYFPSFSRAKAEAAPRPKTLIEAVGFCVGIDRGHSSPSHELLVAAVVKVLHLQGRPYIAPSGSKLVFNPQRLMSFMAERGKSAAFREFLHTLMMNAYPTEQEWTSHCDSCLDLLEIDSNAVKDEAKAYLLYSGQIVMSVQSSVQFGNRFLANNGIVIEVGTIHSVKGETHDATLVLETKSYKLFDVAEMLPYLLDFTRQVPVAEPDRPTSHDSLRAGFMKRLYVGATRPRHLVAFSVNVERLTEDQRKQFSEKGWRVIDVVSPVAVAG